MATLFGRYEYAGELGRGASGRVFAVLDRAADDARRAIKVVPVADSGRLVWEFARLCQVEHPRLARVRELVRLSAPAAAPFGLPRGTLLLVEDFVEGAPLSHALRASGDARGDARARLELTARIAVSVGEALGALHEASLVHGDVKPDNVLCEADGQGATLIDLGFARPPALASVPRGTPHYMAPELFAGVCTPAADVYALGAVLYECLRGEVAGAEGAASASHSEVPWRVRDLRALALPDDDPVLRVLSQLLAADHTQRPADGRAALALLLPALAQQGLTLAHSALAYAGLSLVRSASERADRARTLPFVGHGDALATLVEELGRARWVCLRGARGAGRSRLIREAIRVLQERRAQAGQSVPTWVDSIRSLALLRDVDAILWLDEKSCVELPAIERAARAATLALRSLSVVLEGGPELPSLADGKVCSVVELGPLQDAEFVTLFDRLLAPDRPSNAVRAAARKSSLGLSGRLCERVCSLSLAGRDLSDPRVFESFPAAAGSAVLSPEADSLATGLAWWGSLLGPALAARWVGSERGARAAYDELRLKGLLVAAEGELLLAPGFAAERRSVIPPRCERGLREQLAQRSEAEHGGERRSGLGFAQLALGREELARAAFLREARALRAEGRSDAACDLLAEAQRWIDDGSLTMLRADSERARGSYRTALAVLGTALEPEARLLRAELLRMSEQAEAAQRELAVLEEQAEARLLARVHAQRARLSFDAGDLDGARARATLALAGDDREAQVRALEVEVLACLTTGELAGAPIDALIARASPRASEPQDGDAALLFLARAPARALSLRAQLRARRGERPLALADLRSAVEHTRALGEAHEVATYALNLGLLELEAGELGRALETLRDAAQRLAQVARTRDLARVLLNFAALALLVGDFSRADAVLTEAARALLGTADHLAHAFVGLLRAELSFARGELELAELGLARALAALPAQALPTRALLAARAAQVALARGSLERAEAYCLQTRENTAEDDTSGLLELHTATLRLALSRADWAGAEQSARCGLGLLHEGISFSDRLRFVLAAIESARASGNLLAQAERAALARAWLERALSSLPSELRAKMRAVPAYTRVLSSGQGEPDPALSHERAGAETAERWRTLVRASRRLFAETREARIMQRLTELALELVHAERALVVAFDERSELSVVARSELARESERGRGFSRSVVEQVALDRRPLLTVEAGSDARLDRAQSVAALEVRSVLCCELFGLRGRAFLYLDDRLRPSAFGADDLALIEDLVELTRQALRTGEELLREARRARRAEQHQRRLSRELARSSDARSLELAMPSLIGDSAVLARVIATARRVASADAPVLITGESGTGKELLARFVHQASPRSTRAFVAESCAAMPDTLLESALFGHVRGAFTGAERAHKGLFEAADGGTLFLDEVGEMSAALQGKLLRVLQEGELRPVGSERTRVVDVRVIGATRRDLHAMVAAGHFREDLYYRLAVVTIELPPLRARPEDVPQLVAHFVAKHGRGRNVQVAPGVLRELASRAWPGNVRELENEVRRALAFSDAEIQLEHLSQPEAREAAHEGSELDVHAHTDRLLRRLVREALSRAEGNVTRAAVLLGVSRFGLQKILKRLQLSAK